MVEVPSLPWPRIALVAAALICLFPFSSPGLALAMGLAIALAVGPPWPALTKKFSKPLLQVSVVLLGFGMNLYAVLDAARRGFLFAAATIVFTFALGALLRRPLGLDQKVTTLLSAGTAICGGSAIAAVALAIGAAEAEISVAIGTVFLLNAIALYLFPFLGHLLALDQVQFGTWAGIAIHDVSSVVAAASGYGQEALQTATAVKLSRTLWIVPVALAAGQLVRRGTDGKDGDATASSATKKTPVVVPWFIGLFMLASVAATFMEPVRAVAPVLQRLAKIGMSLTLLLIGASLSRKALRDVGFRPALLGVCLWIAISVAALVVVTRGL